MELGPGIRRDPYGSVELDQPVGRGPRVPERRDDRVRPLIDPLHGGGVGVRDPDPVRVATMSCGSDSTSIVATTFPASGSIGDTEPSTKLDTQRLPNAESANRGESPTSTVPTIRSVAGSIRPTTSSFSQEDL